MNVPLNEKVYINNGIWGRMFAADLDKKDSDHMVETGNTGTSEKYVWKIYTDGAHYYIQNIQYGFMFAADRDKKDDDHIVECDPDVKTLNQAKEKGQDDIKWKWEIHELEQPSLGIFTIENCKYDGMFAADLDLKDDDHIVECRPYTQGTSDKWRWNFIAVDESLV